MKIYVTEWVWTCGDGCCSDSGIEVKCGRYAMENVADRPSAMSSPNGNLSAWIVADIISVNLGERVTCPDFRTRFEAAVGHGYTGSDWNWPSHLPTLSEEEVGRAFRAFGLEFEGIEWEQEER